MKSYRAVFLVVVLSKLSLASPFSGLVDFKGASFPGVANKSKVLIVFWATWCQDCRSKLRKELPELDKTADTAVVTINTDTDASRATDFITKQGIMLPVLRDSSGEVRKELKIFSVPHWMVYTRSSTAGNWKLVNSEPAFDWTAVMKALGKS